MPQAPCIGTPICYSSELDLAVDDDFFDAVNHLDVVHAKHGCEVAQEMAKSANTPADIPVWEAQYAAHPSTLLYAIWASQKQHDS